MSVPANSILQFDCDILVENLGPRWTQWINRLEQYFICNKITDDTQMVACLFYLGGERLHQIHGTLKEVTLPETCNTEYKKAKQRLDTYFNPKKNPVLEIFNFMQAKQEQHETIQQYVSRLRMLSEFCEFGESTNKWIIAQVITYCKSDKLRREFLAKSNIEYKDLLEMGRSHDNVERQALQIEGKVEVKEEFVNSIRNGGGKNGTNRSSQSSHGRKCFSCGGSYPHEGDCPARGKECHVCKGLNHLARVCKLRNDQVRNGRERVNQIDDRGKLMESDDDKDFIFTVQSESLVKHPEIAFGINGTSVRMKIDTMSSLNVLDEHSFNKIKDKPKLKSHEKSAYAYGSSRPIQFLGEFSAALKVGEKVVQATIAVTKGAYGNLLGYETARMFGVDPVAQILGEKPRSKQVTFEQPVKQSLETSQLVQEKYVFHLYAILCVCPGEIFV